MSESRSSVPHSRLFSRPVMYALALSILAWLLHNFAAMAWPAPLGWMVKLLNLPVATFWLFFPRYFRLDYWYGNVFETYPPGTFYLHMFSATIAYWLCLKLPAIFRALRRSQPREGLASSSPRRSRYLEAGHRLVLAFLISSGIWCLHAYQLKGNWFYLIALDVSTLFNFPIALAGAVFPPDLRGLDVWFLDPQPVEMDRARLLRHLLLGIIVYFGILQLWAKVARRRKIAQSSSPVAEKGHSEIA